MLTSTWAISPGTCGTIHQVPAPDRPIAKGLATDKKRILAEIDGPGGSVSGVAKRYGISVPLLFRWKRELAPAAKSEATFLPVTITDAAAQPTAAPLSMPEPAPVIVERSAPGIEVELNGGRRVRFERDIDPETVRRLVTLLEGETP